MLLTAEDLLAGSELRLEVELPDELRPPAVSSGSADSGGSGSGGSVVVRPLTVRDLQRIGRAARDDDELAATLMIQQGLAEPALGIDQVDALPAGLARFLLERVNEVTGMSLDGGRLDDLVRAPLARACFVLAREFGWTPEEVSALTVGQIMMYVEMARRGES
jgi:hypothetical protein